MKKIVNPAKKGSQPKKATTAPPPHAHHSSASTRTEMMENMKNLLKSMLDRVETFISHLKPTKKAKSPRTQKTS